CHLTQRGQSWVAACCSHSPMKTNIVYQKLLRIVQSSKHLSDLIRHDGEMLRRRTFGRYSGSPNFKDGASFKHIVETETMQFSEQSQRLAIKRRGSIEDKRSGTLSRLQNSHRSHSTQSRTQRRPTYSQLLCQFALGR